MSGLQPTQITLFHILWFVTTVAGCVLGASFGLSVYHVPIGSIAGGLVGLFLGNVLGWMPYRLGTRFLLRNIERSSNEELWKTVHLGFWNFHQSWALLTLKSRGQDVSGELPRIIEMLESDDVLTRVYGWDALRLVFKNETKAIGDYNPRSSAEDCRIKVAMLRSSMGQSPSVPSKVTTERGEENIQEV